MDWCQDNCFILILKLKSQINDYDVILTDRGVSIVLGKAKLKTIISSDDGYRGFGSLRNHIFSFNS